MFDFLVTLNSQQKRAVVLPAEHALILAGAGSGKTRVLITRLAWLIRSGQASPHEIMAVTFTNKAAQQMKERLADLLGLELRGLWVGTFHGLCNRMLRLHSREAQLDSTFQIIDNSDQLTLVKRALKALNIDEQYGPAKQFVRLINAHKEQGVRALKAQNLDGSRRIERFIAVYKEYEAICQRENVVDFSELLLRTYELFCQHQSIRDHYRKRFKHILVDEFQDTNRQQYLWIKCLAMLPAQTEQPEMNGAKVFAVGDDDQSIYRFRGAEIGNMADFVREFSIDPIIRLEQNYRSTTTI